MDYIYCYFFFYLIIIHFYFSRNQLSVTFNDVVPQQRIYALYIHRSLHGDDVRVTSMQTISTTLPLRSRNEPRAGIPAFDTIHNNDDNNNNKIIIKITILYSLPQIFVFIIHFALNHIIYIYSDVAEG